MKLLHRNIILPALLPSVLFVSFPALSTNSWEQVELPSKGPAQSIGSYANGCLSGGQALALNGEGYQVIRPSRQRYYAHPNMVEFLKKLAMKTKALGLDDLLIADIAMPRGGDFSSGHSSHQTGLDADIWLNFASEVLMDNERESPEILSVVDVKRFKLERENWTREHTVLFEAAASEPEVARIFVHPVIKDTLCKTVINDRAWLRKIRPWWGHHYHMHIRLNCPEGSLGCLPQYAPPPGDGCGEELLSWWPKPDNGTKPTSVKKKKNKPVKVKPEQCEWLLKQ